MMCVFIDIDYTVLTKAVRRSNANWHLWNHKSTFRPEILER